MEYALPSHNYHTTAELNGGDLFSMPLQQSAQESLAAAAAAQPAQAASFTAAEVVPAESQLNPVVASLTAQQKAQISQPLLSAQGTAPKVKRQDDIWTGNCRPIYHRTGCVQHHRLIHEMCASCLLSRFTQTQSRLPEKANVLQRSWIVKPNVLPRLNVAARERAAFISHRTI